MPGLLESSSKYYLMQREEITQEGLTQRLKELNDMVRVIFRELSLTSLKMRDFGSSELGILHRGI